MYGCDTYLHTLLLKSDLQPKLPYTGYFKLEAFVLKRENKKSLQMLYLSEIHHFLTFRDIIKQTNSFVNSFIPITSRDWNSLRLSVFPATHNLSFKTHMHP